MSDRKKIKLMADYQCYPLWWDEPTRWGDINPATLPLDAETILRLKKWADAMNATLTLADPASSGFPTQQEKEAFEQEGIEIFMLLEEELASEYEVSYQM